MSTVSCSETLSSSENEEWSCSDGCDFAGYEYLSSKSSQGSIDIDSDCEATMSENDEWAVDKFSASFIFSAGPTKNQAEQRVHRRLPQKHANLISEDPTLSETSWTDQKHNLYLKSIEEAFVKTLYERSHYIYSCKRWKSSERITASVSGKDLYEDVGTEISCDYQPLDPFPEEKTSKAQMRCNVDEEIQNRTKRSRLERICIKQGQQEQERVYSCKSLKVPAGEGSGETGDVPNEDNPKGQTQCFKDTNSKHDSGRNMQEDQVVPSVENASQSSS